MAEEIYDVYWEGPYSVERVKEKYPEASQHVLYQIYGTHPVYGRNTLLYIGETSKQAIATRVQQHDCWLYYEPDPCTVYVASIGRFTTWKDRASGNDEYEKAADDIIIQIESLLIYAHQPVYNQRNKQSAESAKHIRIFNTGRKASLIGEVSGLYYIDDHTPAS